MTKQRSTVLGLAVPLIFAVVLLFVVPAAAHHKSDHENGGGGGNSQMTADSGATEDNDSNDNGTPNDVVDNDDNAHPSGKDRSVEHGNSENQGKATSDPDDDTRGPERTNGGADKADGPGGADLADQDGNNGCGNDDDFEDDNEGWCAKGRPSTPPPPTTDNPPPNVPDKIDDEKRVRPNAPREIPEEVLSLTPELPAPEVAAIAPPAERASSLPMTGSNVATLLVVALGLIVLGSSMVVARRRT
jgi:LPXTG-motif cell wall-anchored protein